MLRGKVTYGSNPATRAIVRLRKIPAEVDAGALVAVRTMSADMQAYAQANAPWTNRTGDARRTLRGYYGAYGSKGGKAYYAALRHGVPYGIWLEVRFSGRWGIVWRTLEAFRGKASGYIKDALKGVGSD